MGYGSTPVGVLRRRCVAREESFTVKRPSTQTSSSGERTEKYSALDATQLIAVFTPNERVVQGDAGESTTGTLQAYARNEVDIQRGDRIDYGGATWEAEEPVGLPRDSDPSLYRITFVRVQ